MTRRHKERRKQGFSRFFEYHFDTRGPAVFFVLPTGQAITPYADVTCKWEREGVFCKTFTDKLLVRVLFLAIV
jgi:hypothetical protein